MGFEVNENNFFNAVGVTTAEIGGVEAAFQIILFVEDNNHRALASKQFNDIEPIVEVCVIFTIIGNENVEGAFRQEKAMGSMVDFLAAKVPNIEVERVLCIFSSLGGERVGVDGDALGAIVNMR